jgi:hypothetical protein
MGWKNKQDMDRYRGRRSQRYAAVGRELEGEVERILQKMLDDKKVDGFRRFPPYSTEDGEGADFSVTRGAGEQAVERRFGVTISLRSWREACGRHSGTTQFCFPIGTKPETIEKRILGLFENG